MSGFNHRQVKGLLACASLCAMLCASPALAQSAKPADESPPGAPLGDQISTATANSSSDTTTEDVVVTGSNIRGVKPVGSPALSVTLEDIKQAGISTPSDLSRIVPQLQTSAFNEASDTNNNTRGSSFDLRGLGSDATLTLINGRRFVPSGGTKAFTDANIVPIQALDRVEIVPDGASAIYGADAVGGVVNFILRKNYSGAEIAARDFNQLGQNRVELSAVVGANFNIGGQGGNIIATVNWSTRNGLLRSASPFLRNDLTPLGGLDSRVNGGTVRSVQPGTIAVQQPDQSYLYYSVNPNGTSVTPGLGNIAADADNYNYLLPERTLKAVVIYTQRLASNVEFSLTGVMSRRTADQVMPQYDTITLPSTSPYFIAGIPGATTSESVNVRYRDAVGKTTENTYLITPSIHVGIGKEWSADAYLTGGLTEGCGLCRTYVSTSSPAFLAANGQLNPFSSSFSDTFYAQNTGPDIDRNRSNFTDIVAKVNGPLFSLPAGKVRIAAGGEYTALNLHYVNSNINTDDASVQTVTNSYQARNVKSLFGEVYVPLIDEDMNVPLIANLAINGAVRHDEYSDFGKTTNPKIGATWIVTPGLSLRGSWGTSFRAPTLQEAATDSGSTIFSPDFNFSGNPLLPTDANGLSTFAYQVGGQPLNGGRLQPEKAQTYSLGADIAPAFLPGLKLSTTYYKVVYKNRIVYGLDIASNYYESPAAAAAFAPYITPAAQPATCNNSDPNTFGPLYRQIFKTAPFNSFVPADFCSAVGIIYSGNINFGRVVQKGLDFNASYIKTLSFGTINLAANWNHIFAIEQTVLPGQPDVEVVSTFGYPVSDRVRATASATIGPVTVGIFGNYVGNYSYTLGPTTSQIPSWLTFDTNVGLDLDRFGGWMRGVRLSATINNIFDRNPPIVLQQGATGGSAFDLRNANPYGRTVQFEVLKRF